LRGKAEPRFSNILSVIHFAQTAKKT